MLHKCSRISVFIFVHSLFVLFEVVPSEHFLQEWAHEHVMSYGQLHPHYNDGTLILTVHCSLQNISACIVFLELHLSLDKVKAEQILLLLFLDEETGPLELHQVPGRSKQALTPDLPGAPGAVHCKPSRLSPVSAHGKQNQQGVEFIPGQSASPLGKLHPSFSLMWL